MRDVEEWLRSIRRTFPKWLLLLAIPLAVWLVIGPFGLFHTGYDLPETVAFNRDIRPILSQHCFACHGPDANTREADLRLDTEEGAKALRDDYAHPAVAPGKPGRSALIDRITHSDPEKRMPPPLNQEGSGGTKLTGRQIALLKKWIDQGAEWERWWAYTAVERPEVPDVDASGPAAIQNPIDRFVLARLNEKGLASTSEADRATLIRRLSLDLTGIPPSIEDVRAFTQDTRPDAYERVVDSLLASPHFGERMALWWLDLVRYAETDGYHSDLHRNISAFRDYVIHAFNENKPFDQFTREQLAGDLLPNPTREQQVAASYNRLGQATKEGGSQPEEYLVKYAVDRVTTVSNAWLASSMQCAQCHDHKYDPFTQKDFYSMAAFFGDVKERGMFPNENQLPPEESLLSREEADSLALLDRKIAHLEGDVERALRFDQPTPTAKEEQLEQWRNERAAFIERHQKVLATQSIESRVIRILPRGDWRHDAGPIVTPDAPDFLPAMEVTGRRPDRLDLANWLVADDNPLTPRAFVNQLWDKFFGHGLSKRLGDFGVQGEAPTHPALLDWLAAEFVASGWDVKHVIRLIVTSGTYRKSSQATEEHLEKDPDNRYLAHQARIQLPAELVRDNALAISGLLHRAIGGESFKPYQPEGYWADIQTFGETGPAAEWTATPGVDQYRRSVYIYWKRSFLHPTLKVFNASTRQVTQAHRTQSNDPRQSLALLNDPIFVEAARVFAAKIMDEGGPSVEARARFALQQAVSRAPSDAEVQQLVTLYRKQLTRYRDDPEAAQQIVSVGQYPVAQDKNSSELAAWTSVARAVLNLHETITRY
jgi:hypothetical protein